MRPIILFTYNESIQPGTRVINHRANLLDQRLSEGNWCQNNHGEHQNQCSTYQNWRFKFFLQEGIHAIRCTMKNSQTFEGYLIQNLPLDGRVLTIGHSIWDTVFSPFVWASISYAYVGIPLSVILLNWKVSNGKRGSVFAGCLVWELASKHFFPLLFLQLQLKFGLLMETFGGRGY